MIHPLETAPLVLDLRDKRIVMKVGGAIVDDTKARAAFAESVAEVVTAGAQIVLVHGGGVQLTRHQEALGLKVQRDARGLRVTNPATAKAAVQVLGGEVNADLVAALVHAGVRAVGLTGADAGLMTVKPLDPALGCVGEVECVSAAVLRDLASAGFVSIIATVAPHREFGFLNVNADSAVAPIAAAFDAHDVLFLSDVPCVRGADGALESLSESEATKLEAEGVLAGGMIPKVDAALAAAKALPQSRVKIASGVTSQPVQSALSADVGTLVFVSPEVPQELPADRTMSTYVRAAPLFVRGSGAWLEDESGKRYLDWISGIGAASLGHGHPALTAAISDQISTLGHVSNLYRHGPGKAFAARLCDRTGMDAVFFSNSGSEANEGALKVARKFHVQSGAPDRQSFVALNGGFHGRTFGSLSVTSKPGYRAPFGEMLDVNFVDPGDFEGLQRALDERPAALILEPLQGEGGINELCGRYLRAAREMCNRTGTVLIHDEVQCGGGRTGTFLASEAAGPEAKPDIVTLAKPIGAGVPIGATLARGAFAEVLVPGDHGSTFGGGTLAARAGLVVLDELDAGLQANIIQLGAALTAGLDDLVERHDALVQRRGRGFIQGIVVPGRAAEIASGLFDVGLLCCTAAGDIVRFLPPYILTEEDLALGLQILDRFLTESL